MDNYVNKNNNSKRKLGIYIHIPFCVRKCYYCDFLSFGGCNDKFDSYVNSLVKEIKTEGSRYNDSYVVESVFIGGGTPSILKTVDIARILNVLKETFEIDNNAEISIECNPGTVIPGFFDKIKAAGVNRVSIGLQSALDDELKLIGRIHTYEDFLNTYQMAKEAGIVNINIDLIHSLPEQTKEKYLQTLNKVIELKPKHISAYSLIIEEGTPIADMKYSFPSENEDIEFYELTERILTEAGYNKYEISNFALEGYECKHNIKYWTLDEYLGFGLGSSSMMIMDGKRTRWHNITNLDKYIAGDYSHEDISVIEGREDMAEYMFLGLRMTEGISVDGFLRRYGKSIESIYGDIIAKHTDEGLLKTVDNRIMLTKRGVELSNYVMKDFL